MNLLKNLSSTMNLIRTSRNQSITEFSEELGVARSSLQELLKGRGNPRIDTVEYIAGRLDVDPISLLSEGYSEQQKQVVLLLLDLIGEVAKLPPEKRRAFADLFSQMITLMEPDA